MRDALSLLDQVLACSDGNVDDGYVMSLLGGMERQILFDLSEAILAKDLKRILAVIDTVFKNGQDLKRFYADLLMHCRHLMLIKMDVRSETLMDLSPGEIETMAKQVAGASIAYIDQVFTLLFNAEASVRHAVQPRLAIEIVFFKIHQIVPALPIDLLIQRMDCLLKDPRLAAAAPGIVEVQAAYGDVDIPSQADSPDESGTGDQSGTDHFADHGPESSTEGAPTDDHGDGDNRNDNDRWKRVVAIIAETKPSIAATLARSQLVGVSPQAFTVAVRDNDYSMNLVRKNLAMIESVCREQADREIKIDFTGDAAHGAQAATAKQKASDIRQQLLNHPMVADALDIFSGKIEEIKIR